MAVTQHAREFPSIDRRLPYIGEAVGSVQLFRAVGAMLIEAMRSDFQRSIAGYWEDLDALLVEGSVVLRGLGAALLESAHVPVVTGEARCVMEELEVRSKTAAELNRVAGIVGIEELAVRGEYLIAESANLSPQGKMPGSCLPAELL